ncbi:MAG: paraquat-inducible protein A [Pseudomonadota bacterium]
MQPEAVSNSPDHDGVNLDGLIACHECDALFRRVPLTKRARAHCTRCGAVLYRHLGGTDLPLALAVAGLGLFFLAHVFPFLALRVEGLEQQSLVVSGVATLWEADMPELAVLVALTSIVFPLFNLLGLLWLLVPLRLGWRPPAAAFVARMMQVLSPWSLLAVFMLGVLISFVKLVDLAAVIPGIALFAFFALIFVTTAAQASFRAEYIWPVPDASGSKAAPSDTAGTDPARYTLSPDATGASLGLEGCHVCGALNEADGLREASARDHRACRRCGAALHGMRKADSVNRCWALVLAAAVMIIPANVYPVMTVTQLGRGEPSTIISGVIQLIGAGMVGLGLIVFIASIAVPLAKLALLVYLLVSVQRRSPWSPPQRTRMYRITEVIGAWSMVDVFIVAVLAALVQLGALATIEPEIGASYFGAVVVITMFAAQAFDPRLIWDHAVRGKRR